MDGFPLSRYHVFQSEIETHFGTRDYGDTSALEDALSEFSAVTGCPVIAVYAFYISLFGSTPRLDNHLKNLLTFYRYLEIT